MDPIKDLICTFCDSVATGVNTDAKGRDPVPACAKHVDDGREEFDRAHPWGATTAERRHSVALWYARGGE